MNTSLLSPLLRLQRRNVPWGVGVRNTAAIVLPAVIGELTGYRYASVAVAVGALVTMMADQPGPYRLRLQRMLLTSAGAGLAALAGSWLGQWQIALLAAAATWGFGAALLVAIGPHATRAGMVSMILLMVMGAEARPLLEAIPVALLVFGGGLLQSLFAISAWPLQRYRPERLALAQAFRGLGRSARAQVQADESTALPPSLNELQAHLHGSGHARGRAVEAFRVLAELAERMRIELLSLADLEAGTGSQSLREAIRLLRSAAANGLDGIAEALANAAPPLESALSQYEAAVENLRHCVAIETSRGTGVLVTRAEALGGQLRAAGRNAATAGSRGEMHAQSAEFRLPRALRPANPLAILRANLRLSSPACRHAIRCGLCLAGALALSHMLPLFRGYWMPMTVAIVLKPDFGTTWRFGLLRMAGTLGGLLLTTAMLYLVGVDNFWIALALMAVLCFGYRELAAVHYGLAVVCLTGVVVILLSFYGIPATMAVHARAVDTVLGSSLALAAYFLWPTWERGRERDVLARMLDAYRAYLVAVLRGDSRDCHETRIAARAARSSAQASLDRLRGEPASRINLPTADALVAQANRFVRAAMLLEAARGDHEDRIDYAALTDFINACDDALRDCARALRSASRPVDEWYLRDRQRELVAALESCEPSSGELRTALRDASDQIVDAINSVAHVLIQRTGASRPDP